MLRWLIALIAAMTAFSLAAHELRPSVVEMREVGEGAYTLDWKVTLSEGSAAILTERLRPVIPEACEATGEATGEAVQRVQAAALMGRVELSCTGDLTGGRFGVSELLGRSDAIARFVPLEAPAQSFRLTAQQPFAMIEAEPSFRRVLADYFVIGAEHILLGWDHLLFVIALVMLVRAPWPVIKAATAFTVAHSITLVATVLGYAGLPGRAVEALIALSIIFLAVEVAIYLRDPDRQTLTRRYPWVVAFAFGLIHGFGFAGALAQIGLPQAQIGPALFAFNVGVEAGQLVVVAVTIAALAALNRASPRARTASLTLATYAIGTIGTFWLIERVIG